MQVDVSFCRIILVITCYHGVKRTWYLLLWKWSTPQNELKYLRTVNIPVPVVTFLPPLRIGAILQDTQTQTKSRNCIISIHVEMWNEIYFIVSVFAIRIVSALVWLPWCYITHLKIFFRKKNVPRHSKELIYVSPWEFYLHWQEPITIFKRIFLLIN